MPLITILQLWNALFSVVPRTEAYLSGCFNVRIARQSSNTMSSLSSIPTHLAPKRSGVLRLLNVVLLIAASFLFAAHYLHLTADFPNHSPWMDWAKYTDEGWYGDAAIRTLERGRWYLPGDFNPAAALPVWPLLELAVFRFAGVSLAAARALSVSVFGVTLLAAYALLRRFRATPNSLAPAAAVVLLAASPFCYAFTRLAILEPLLVLLTLLALLAVSSRSLAPEAGNPGSQHRTLRRLRLLAVLALGVLIPVMILTKTTAVFLLPAIGWMLWASSGRQLRRFVSNLLPAAVLASILWVAYFALFVRPHFLDDYRYLFSANGYTGITLETAGSVLADTFADGVWMGRLIFPLGLGAAAATVVMALRRRSVLGPLAPTLLLWIAGYLAFLAYHDNLQPRYYLVVAVPLTLLVAAVAERVLTLPALWRSGPTHLSRVLRPAAATLAVGLFLTIVAIDTRQMLHFVRTPEYTFTAAAASIRQVIASNPSHNPLVLSISGSDLSLMTGLPSICDDFGTMELATRVATYRPGWYVTWNQVDDDKMDALATLYSLHRVAQFPAFDDPERNLLIVYRLDPATPSPSHPLRRRSRRPTLHLIGSPSNPPLGQQPSDVQLGH